MDPLPAALGGGPRSTHRGRNRLTVRRLSHVTRAGVGGLSPPLRPPSPVPTGHLTRSATSPPPRPLEPTHVSRSAIGAPPGGPRRVPQCPLVQGGFHRRRRSGVGGADVGDGPTRCAHRRTRRRGRGLPTIGPPPTQPLAFGDPSTPPGGSPEIHRESQGLRPLTSPSPESSHRRVTGRHHRHIMRTGRCALDSSHRGLGGVTEG